jgi:predicted SnoaL-like aldol condensation-catalyzing enzyme
VNIDEAARRWADTWERGWNDHTVESIVELYAADAVLSTEPFREPFVGRAGVRKYVAQVFAEEESAAARFGEPIVGADGAAVRWWATLLEHGMPTTLAGTSWLRFDDDGLVIEKWDTWIQSQGRREPPGSWR